METGEDSPMMEHNERDGQIQIRLQVIEREAKMFKQDLKCPHCNGKYILVKIDSTR